MVLARLILEDFQFFIQHRHLFDFFYIEESQISILPPFFCIGYYKYIISIILKEFINIPMNPQQQAKQEPLVQDDSSSSQLVSSDQYIQRKALPLDEMMAEGSEDVEALRYLMNVRQQAQNIKQKTKLIQKKNRKSKAVYQFTGGKIGQKETQDKNIEPWVKEVLQNWKCVIANVSFLRRKGIQSDHKKKINLNEKPMIYALAGLPVGKIQSAIEQISNSYFSEGGKYYYLWMYSLLAIHQAESPYKCFENLASACACIEEEKKDMGNGNYLECLVVGVILERYFQQMHLRRKVKELGEN